MDSSLPCGGTGTKNKLGPFSTSWRFDFPGLLPWSEIGIPQRHGECFEFEDVMWKSQSVTETGRRQLIRVWSDCNIC